MKPMLEFCAHHSSDLMFALLFAIIADLLRIGSLIRSGLRKMKNRLAEQSVARLRKRIIELEQYRETIRLYLTAERALYLHILGMVLAVLVLMCMTGIVLMLGRFRLLPNAEILATGVLMIAVVFGTYGVRLASMDTRPKVSELITKLDGEISELKAKLVA